ncbi:Oligoxyloglucan reducing end-specific cellobiohydrolase [Aspergillus steynii IBT 23096]|uniref:Oligoxyloglucan reducing end-specific cellobiohydrolase n=1 Tax=Aspergillus steynii IBT 23096 TaxID=1392250 RepID=A0A2I2GDF0_9EURO|nr:Oligoxyloglucan reducing end-specific cellobiohydrolase [Aspergillus steynii IBT 23096]PLB50925.1 Oligoxyloglucan reducing end-specific cellobiohydrolase [Aspergillus steynii IBT 23096]
MGSTRLPLTILTLLFFHILLPIANASPSVITKREVRVDVKAGTMGAGTYPRATYIKDKSLLGCFRSYKGDKLAIETVRSTDRGKTWKPVGTAITELKKEYGLNNCYLHQLPDSDRILLAFRNPQRDAADTKYVKHIMLVYSSDDGGKTWAPLSTVATTETTGLGLWEPFMMEGLDGDLMLFYSRETRTDGKDQNSILVRSTDGGKTWGKEQTISGGDIQKRDGMLGVARVAKGSKKLIAVFESLTPNTGITSITSDDDGKTWGNRKLVYKGTNGPPSEAAPQIVRVGEKTLVVSFSTWEDDREAGKSKPPNVKVVVSTDGGATWGQKTLVHENCHWAGEVAVDGNSLLVMCDHNDGTSVSMRVSIH